MKKDTALLASERILHVAKRVNSEVVLAAVESASNNVLDGKGSFHGSLDTLGSYAEASAIKAWYVDGDLRATKKWLWTAAVIQQGRMSRIESSNWSLSHATYGSLPVVCCDDANLRAAMGKVIEVLHVSRKNTAINHLSQQIGLVLQGRPNEAGARLADFIEHGNLNRADTSFASDFEVFRALHFGSDGELIDSLKQICRINFDRSRLSLEDGFTEGLMSTPATIYLRLAWLMGRTIPFDDPLVPLEWMPEVDGLDHSFGFPPLQDIVTAAAASLHL